MNKTYTVYNSFDCVYCDTIKYIIIYKIRIVFAIFLTEYTT